MPIRIDFNVVTIPDLNLVANAFFAAADKVKQLERPMHDAVDIVSQEIEQNFASEGRPSSWAPLAESTILERERQGYGAGPILTASGALRGEATSVGAWDISGGGQAVVASLSVPGYGNFHLTGFTGGWQHDMAVPARDWSYISPEAEAEIDNLFLNSLLEPLAEIPG